MKRWFNNAVVGGAIGAAVVIGGLVLLSAFVTGRSLDTISLGILVPAYVLLATLILANTNNNIDSRVRATLDRYEADYKAEIAANQKERQTEIERDERERKEAMEKAAEIMQAQVLPRVNELQQKNQDFVRRVVVVLVMAAVVQLVGQRDVWMWLRKQWRRRKRAAWGRWPR